MTASSGASAITIVPLSPRDTKAFIAFPQRVYQNDPCWIPPLKLERKEFLNPRKNPFFQEADGQLFLALQGRQPVGRIAAVINHLHDRQHHERAGFFGLFECLPHAEAAATALFHAATEWVRERGATFIRGPLNLSTNELACGLLVEGFDTPPVFDSAYNPPYYAEYIESNGFTACKDLLAFIKHYAPFPERMAQAITRLRARGTVTVRPINMRDFTAEVARIAALYNEAWSENWGFVPITEAGAQHLAKHLKLAVIPELTLIAEVNREPVGCFVAIPDMNQALRHLHGRLTPWGLLRFFYHRRRIDTVRVAMVGVKKRYRRLGVNILLLAHVWEQAPPLGYIHGELAWILEDNELMIRAIEEIGAKPYKRYRLYQKDVV